MKTCFNVVDMPVRDMIADQHPIEDIVAVTQFQTAINCGASIESLTLVDINQEIEDDEVINILYMRAVVNGEDYKIILHTKSSDEMLKYLLTYSSSSSIVMNYVRQSLG
ncbi:hypothetical protein D3C80_651490 [compost metagenome]